jgi:hypothetical protein
MIPVCVGRFIYRGRIAVFSIKVLRDERICVVAEQRPDCSEEEVCSYSSSLRDPLINPFFDSEFLILVN